jgi:hypothetical protein
MNKKIAEAARIITIPAFTSFLSLVLFWFLGRDIYLNGIDFVMAIISLTVIPLFSYPCSFLIPAIRKKGRSGQRRLAMYFSAAGYLTGFLYAVIAPTEPRYRIIMCSYLLSIVFLLLVNHFLGFHASGHACSTVGPALCIMIYCGGMWGLISLALVGMVAWSSLTLGRHKLSELTVGGAISTFSILLLMMI